MFTVNILQGWLTDGTDVGQYGCDSTLGGGVVKFYSQITG